MEIVDLLLAQKVAINPRDGNGWTPLHLAAHDGSELLAKRLLAEQADPLAKNQAGMTPLHMAAMAGNKEVAELLLNKKVDPNVRNREGWTPLHSAVHRDRKEVVELLLNHQADPDARNLYGWTPLHLASRYGSAGLVKMLLDQGTEVETQTIDGWRPLHLAAFRGHPGVVEMLIDKGADINSTTTVCWTPIRLAKKEAHEEVAQRLLEKGADPERGGLFESPRKCQISPRLKPKDTESAIVGLSLFFHGNFLIWVPSNPILVYFIRLDPDRNLYTHEHLIPSNYVQGNHYYLLNAKPGRYAVVAGLRHQEITLRKQGIFFPKAFIEQTSVSVAPGSVAYMGEYTVGISLFKKEDEAQEHYAKLLRPVVTVFGLNETGSRVSLRAANHDPTVEAIFLKKTMELLGPTGWTEQIQRRLDELR